MLAKRIFGHDHEIQYDCIINHDAYDHLRISLEVPREQDTEALVLLNGKEVGKVEVLRQYDKKNRLYFTTLGYKAYRLKQGVYELLPDIYPKLNKAVAHIITDLV